MVKSPRILSRRDLMIGSAATLIGTGIASKLAFARTPLKTAGIYTLPVEQQWISRIHKAALIAHDAGQIDYKFAESISNTDYPRVMREYAESGVKLIVGEIFGIEPEANEVALDYPDVSFLMGTGFGPDKDVPNMAVFDNYIQDASYLSGIVAGALTKGNIGMVGGFPIPEVNRLMHAFIAGVREVSPKTRFQVSFIGSWYDPPKAKETAFAMIDNGADMLYAERFGVSDAAKERNLLTIGNVINTQPDYPNTVVTSALWHFEPTLKMAIDNVNAGTFVSENYGIYSNMKYGGCSLAPLGTFASKVPQETMNLVKKRETEIKNGSFTVEINDTEPKSS